MACMPISTAVASKRCCRMGVKSAVAASGTPFAGRHTGPTSSRQCTRRLLLSLVTERRTFLKSHTAAVLKVGPWGSTENAYPLAYPLRALEETAVSDCIRLWGEGLTQRNCGTGAGRIARRRRQGLPAGCPRNMD